MARAFGASQPAISALGRAAQAAGPYAPVVGGGAALADASSSDSAAPPTSPRSLVEAAGIKLPGATQPGTVPTAPAAATVPTTVPPTNAVTRVGKSYTGAPNISGEITVNGAASGGGSGAPRSLVEYAGVVPGSAGRSNWGGVMSNPLVASALGGGSTGVTAPVVRDSTNDWQSRNDLRNAQVSASSITNNGGSWDQHKGMSPEAAYAAALGNADMAARAGQAGADVAAMRENAGIQREGVQQAGANQRSLWQYALEQQKVNQAAEAQGYTNRTNALVEAARRQVAGEQDPTKRRGLVAYLHHIQGGPRSSEWGVQVTPTTKNVDGSTTMGNIVRYNRATGQTEIVQAQAQGGGPIGQNAQAVSIRDNPNMTREQKVEALRKLGYS